MENATACLHCLSRLTLTNDDSGTRSPSLLPLHTPRYSSASDPACAYKKTCIDMLKTQAHPRHDGAGPRGCPKMNARYVECSSKEMKGVEEIFERAILTVVANDRKTSNNKPTNTSGGNGVTYGNSGHAVIIKKRESASWCEGGTNRCDRRAPQRRRNDDELHDLTVFISHHDTRNQGGQQRNERTNEHFGLSMSDTESVVCYRLTDVFCLEYTLFVNTHIGFLEGM